MIEKGKASGAHLLCGANMRPSAMEELFPDLDPSDWPVYGEVEKDAVYLLTKKHAIPLTPPSRRTSRTTATTSPRSRSSAVSSARRPRRAGAYLLTETSADKLLVDSDRIVRGVRSGDKGRDREGKELGNFEPGSDLAAKATVLAEGTLRAT